eukprot:62257-Ditylum_brightwellii.AAC.1
MRLLADCDLVRFYQEIGRSPLPPNMKWDSIIKSLKHQWEGQNKRGTPWANIAEHCIGLMKGAMRKDMKE